MDEQIIIMRKSHTAVGGGHWYDLDDLKQAPGFGSVSSMRLEMAEYPDLIEVRIKEAGAQ